MAVPNYKENLLEFINYVNDYAGPIQRFMYKNQSVRFSKKHPELDYVRVTFKFFTGLRNNPLYSILVDDLDKSKITKDGFNEKIDQMFEAYCNMIVAERLDDGVETAELNITIALEEFNDWINTKGVQDEIEPFLSKALSKARTIERTRILENEIKSAKYVPSWVKPVFGKDYDILKSEFEERNRKGGKKHKKKYTMKRIHNSMSKKHKKKYTMKRIHNSMSKKTSKKS